MDIPKKYWWLVGIVVPIIVAIIAVVPPLLKEDAGETINNEVNGTQIIGDVAFNNMNIIVEQARQMLGKELPEDLLKSLHQALKFIQSKEFYKAIPALESAKSVVPVPAVFNNLGAAYLATGNKDRAKDYFEKALDRMPNEEAANFNLNQIVAAQTVSGIEKSEKELSTNSPTVTSKESQGAPATLAPATGGYASIRLETHYIDNVRFTIRVNDLPIGVYESNQYIVLDRFLRAGAQNTISWEFESANKNGPWVKIFTKLDDVKEEWFLIYEFKVREDRLRGGITLPFAGIGE